MASEKQRAYHREYYRRPGNKEKATARAKAWAEANPEKARENWERQNAKKAKGGMATGEKNAAWKGDAASYYAIHLWITRRKGRPSACECCGSQTAKKFEWANVDHAYRRDPDDYVRLCTSCHRRYDYETGLAAKGGRRPLSQ